MATAHPHLVSIARGDRTDYYYRRTHGPAARIRAVYDTPEFWKEYNRFRISDQISQIVTRIDDLVDLLMSQNLTDHAEAVKRLADDMADTDRDINFELRAGVRPRGGRTSMNER